jgi:hypothetical protein
LQVFSGHFLWRKATRLAKNPAEDKWIVISILQPFNQTKKHLFLSTFVMNITEILNLSFSFLLICLIIVAKVKHIHKMSL